MVEQSNQPLDLQGSWLRPLLPKEDQIWLDRNDVAMMVPLVRAGQIDGFIAVGQRRNDLEFGRDALSFLSALAAAAALALAPREEFPAAPTTARQPEPAAECESCRQVTDASSSRCACGGQLRSAALPLVLSDKFHVEALLGVGGMGVVYGRWT